MKQTGMMVQRTMTYLGIEGHFPAYYCHDDRKFYYKTEHAGHEEYREIVNSERIKELSDRKRLLTH